MRQPKKLKILKAQGFTGSAPSEEPQQREKELRPVCFPFFLGATRVCVGAWTLEQVMIFIIVDGRAAIDVSHPSPTGNALGAASVKFGLSANDWSPKDVPQRIPAAGTSLSFLVYEGTP